MAEEIGSALKEKDSFHVDLIRSTVLPGTNEKVNQILEKASGKKRDTLFSVISNPEFLREGVAVDDFMKPDRVVVGTQSEKAKKIVEELFAPLVRQGNPIIYMDERSAELTKYAANSFLATKITFMNEIANLCDRLGADVDMVRKGMGTDSRIGNRFLFSGIGYGGSCFPKDVQALANSATEVDYDFKILNAVMDINDEQKTLLIPKIEAYFKNELNGKTITMWGLAFKPNTDDIREAPALYNIDKLLALGAKVKVFDPEAMDNVKAIYGDKIVFCNNQYEALKDSDALLIITEWPVFRTPEYGTIKEYLSTPVIFDGRNLYDIDHMQELGFNYFSVGRKEVINE